MDVLLFQTRGIKQAVSHHAVVLFGIHAVWASAPSKKMLSSYAIFKSPWGSGPAEGVHLFVKMTTVFSFQKGKQLLWFTREWHREYKRRTYKENGRIVTHKDSSSEKAGEKKEEDVMEGHTEWVTKPYWIYLSCSASQMNLIYRGWQQGSAHQREARHWQMSFSS